MTFKLLSKLKSKRYRDLFVAGQIKTGIPFQIRAMRDQRGWTQEELGKRAGLPQSAVARLENPDSGHSPTAKTLLKVASALDVALIIRYASFAELADWVESRPRVIKGLSPEALAVKGFEEGVTSYSETGGRLGTSPERADATENTESGGFPTASTGRAALVSYKVAATGREFRPAA